MTEIAMPPSIRRFSQAWLGSTVFWLIGTALTWGVTQRRLAQNPDTAAVLSWALPAIVALVLATTVLVWWLVVRRASIVGKWLALALAVFSGLRGMLNLFGILADPLATSVMLAGAVLTIVAAAMLMRDDARIWFGDVEEVEE